MSLEDRPDGELLAGAVCSGEQESFAELVRRHGAMVLNTCRRLLANEQDAEDAAQAVFMVLWERAASLRGQSSVAAWLHRVARNVCRNASRARAARTKREREVATMGKQTPPEHGEWLAIKDMVDEQLDQLPEKYRLPVILFHLEGYSLEEVAGLLGLKSATVATRLRRGRERLRSRLARRGTVVAAAALGSMLTAHSGAAAAAAPPLFVAKTIQAVEWFAAGHYAAEGVLSLKSAALAKGAISTITMAKLKLAAALALGALAVVGGGVAAVQIAAHVGPPVRRPQEGAQADAPGGLASQDGAQDASTDKQQLQGTWQIASLSDSGRNVPLGNLSEAKLVFEDERFRFFLTERRVRVDAIYELNASTDPKSIDFRRAEGRTQLGIYQIDGDELTICLNEQMLENGGERPTEFVSQRESRNDLLIMARHEGD